MKARPGLRALGIAQTLAVLAVLGMSAASADWPMLRADIHRSGIADAVAAAGLDVAWSVKLGSSVDSSPAIADGKIFVGTADGAVFCLHEADGSTVWQAPTDGCVVSSPAIHQGTVYVGSVDRCLYAFDAASGAVRWRVRTWEPVVASPLVFAGRVYFGSMDGSFKCLEADTGRPVWEQQSGPISGAAAADEAGVVFYGDEAGTLWARDAATGTQIWKASVTGGFIRAPLVTDAAVIAGVMSPTALRAPRIKYLLAFDKATGAELWSKEGQSSVLHIPVADQDIVYYATVSGYTSDTTLFANRLSDGKDLWKNRLGGVADSSPVLAGDYLLFGNHDSHFHVVEKKSGREVRSIDIGAKLYSSPAVVDGRVYFGTGDGKLYCLK